MGSDFGSITQELCSLMGHIPTLCALVSSPIKWGYEEFLPHGAVVRIKWVMHSFKLCLTVVCAPWVFHIAVFTGKKHNLKVENDVLFFFFWLLLRSIV